MFFLTKKIGAVAAISLALAAAGCGSSVQGQPSATAGAPPSSDSSSSVPKVAHPLDTTKFQKDPCSVLTEAQLASLGLTTKGKPQSGTGPMCAFNDSAHSSQGIGFGITFVTANTQGLASIYQQKDTFALFDPLPPIQGYPAIDYSASDDRSRGSAGIAVGVSDQLIFEVDVELTPKAPNRSDPVPVGVKVADMVLTNLKGAQ